MSSFLPTVLALFLVPAVGFAQEAAPASPAAASHQKAASKLVVAKVWSPDNICPVQGKKLAPGREQLVEVEGRTIAVCCKRCVAAVKKDPDTWVAKYDQKMIAAQKANYPLTTCPVSGDKLGADGEPHDVLVEGRLVRLCCGGCEEKLKKEPKQILAKLDAALLAAQPVKEGASCPISNKKLDPAKAVPIAFGTQIVWVCCKNCVAKVEKDPAKYLAEASGEKGAAEKGDSAGKK